MRRQPETAGAAFVRPVGSPMVNLPVHTGEPIG